MPGTLYLVGAGPGDPELISVKGIKAIQRADVILYDALVSAELLTYAQPKCRLIYVGKRKGKKAFTQEEINRLLVFYAYQCSAVVRLKGGDPFVFGRGHEELAYATKCGVDVDVIPGISSALAAPAAAGIPLTRRGANESFWVVTGTVASGDMPGDFRLAAQSTATIVVLMGVSQLPRILEIIVKERSALEPVAIIEQATCDDQNIITGSAASLLHQMNELRVQSPAVIVIGQVVNHAQSLPPVMNMLMPLGTLERSA